MSRTSPLIGLTTYSVNESLDYTMPANYVAAVRRAGGVPILLPPGEIHAAVIVGKLDGIVLSGGGDIDPLIYGGSPHPAVYMVDHERDQMELELARMVVYRQLPTLAICRGLQILNVALGGSLHPHLPDVVGEQVLHRAPPRLPTPHPVKVDPSSLVGRIMATVEVSPMSWHHQAIDRLGEDLNVVARAPDGVIEAVEHESHRWLAAVQWHPEITAHEDDAQQRLFDELIHATF